MSEQDPNSKKLSINQWAEDDRPREKLLLKGKASLSDAELIAILISSGSREESAVDLSKRILHLVGNDLNKLASLGVKDLCKIKGIGEAKAISIISALELGRRRSFSDKPEQTRLQSSNQIYEFMKPELLDLPFEQFWIILLRQNLTVIKKTRISEGGISGTVVDLRLIFKEAIEQLATQLILVHNHPSGSCKPSAQDEVLTKKIAEAGKIMDIRVLDHLIFANHEFFSFANEGLL
ncbi:MAG TPA: DNA repair protein RadC [Catalimonadaceae bacterium]|jgi:DNA repair protein RadC|nr:DNA repair protein RadC [Catalimonadaceae bacterium]